MKSHFLLECLVLNSSVINLNQIVLCLLCLNNFDLKTGQLASKKKKKVLAGRYSIWEGLNSYRTFI